MQVHTMLTCHHLETQNSHSTSWQDNVHLTAISEQYSLYIYKYKYNMYMS